MKDIFDINRLEKALVTLNIMLERQDINPHTHEKIECIFSIANMIIKYHENGLKELCPYFFNRGGAEVLNKQIYSLKEHKDKNFYEGFDFDRVVINSIFLFKEIYFSLNRKYKYEIHHPEVADAIYIDKKVNLLLESVDLFHGDLLPSIELIKNEFHITLLNFYLGGKSYQSFINYENTVKEADGKIHKIEFEINKLNAEFENKKKEVEKLETVLNKQKEGFNFVALSKGFSQLLSEKEKSRNWNLRFLIGVGLLILSVPIFNIWVHLNNNTENNWSNISWQQALAYVGLELLLIYFFRVALYQYRAVQSQIMQLELRKSLCQFIQNYAEYAKEIKQNDKEALEKFENLIFSSIVANDDKIPTTFDGMEQITKLTEIFKK